MFRLVLEKAEEPETKLPTSAGSWKKQESSRKNIYFCFIDYAKDFDCVDHNKLWEILKEMGIPDHLTCLLRNLYAGQEAMVRTGHGTTNWFQIGKGVYQGCITSHKELMFLNCDFGVPKIKSDTISTVSPSISHEVMRPDAMIFVF